ncbi:enoyl-CoA hydratase [Acidisphaera sp. S103]|uniref:enoyl-CoA hydratase n=1 Tax=Acidisphaera sp. S103 TaxID=1747223 RepID=UPI00131B294D|nr:enoyl-CoA hydratase [Acidisphaera sp. S103]
MNIPLPTENMLAAIDGPIGWMTFNKPARRNAVSLDMWDAIPVILDYFEQDPAVRVIVLKGAGEQAFVSGADISQFEAMRSSRESNAAYDRASEEASRRLAGCSKPTIAMIRGFCIGGGVAIAIGCDIRIAGEGARFGIPAARLGLGYGAPGVKKLMELVGPSFTKEIFFTARHFSAVEAREMGLVNRVVADDALEDYTRQYCATIGDNAPMTLHALKHTVGELLRGEKADLAASEALVQACFDSQDYIEGRRAFMEKRRPVFGGH